MRRANMGNASEMGDCILRQFCRVDEEFGFALAVKNRVAQHHGRIGDIGAADVESPGDRIGLGQHDGIGGGLFEVRRDIGELVLRALAGELGRLDGDWLCRPLRLVRPDGIDWIAVDRSQLGSGLGGGLLEASDLVGRHQPRVVAHHLARASAPSPAIQPAAPRQDGEA